MKPINSGRMVIYVKDVIILTGRRDRTARRLLERIRQQNGKEKGGYVTVEEFCRFTGLKEEYVRSVLK